MPEATSSGEPDAGNPHVRFDEGRGTSVPSYSTGSEGPVIHRIVENALDGGVCVLERSRQGRSGVMSLTFGLSGSLLIAVRCSR
jgi:hypothetical protein